MAECTHERKTKSIVGGFTCDDCGIYLFDHNKKPEGPDNPPLSIVGGVGCRFDCSLGKWVPIDGSIEVPWLKSASG